MRLSQKIGAACCALAVGVGLAFIYIPLIVLAIYAFNSSNILEWPPPGLTLDWFPKAIEDEFAREAFVTSLKAGAAATAIAIVLGTLASLAVARHRFFGRETISFLVDPADRPARDRHRRRPQQHLHPGARHRPQPLHRDRRPRHLLHRRRLQQRRRPPAPRLGLLRGGLGRPRRPHLADLPLRHLAQHENAPSAPAPCSPSPSPSTRSSSPTSRSAPAKKPCRSGSSATSSAPTSCRSSTPSR